MLRNLPNFSSNKIKYFRCLPLAYSEVLFDPSPTISNFGGDTLEYNSLIRAFESLIEAKTTCAKDRMYYLEQHTTGEVRYEEPKKLLKKKYGNEYKIATAFVNKALLWPALKPEDSKSFHKFAVYLISCKNAMSNNEYMTKFDL